MTDNNHIICRSTADILTAALKIVGEPETSANEVLQLARLAFFHRVQINVWSKLSKQYEEVAAIVVYSYGTWCSPGVSVLFKDGTKNDLKMESDFVTEFDIENAALGLIWDHQLKKEE